MGAVGNTFPTLLDVASRTDKSGRIPKIVEILNLTNEVLTAMPWVQCNEGTSHKTVVRTGIPAATWRLLNYGVPQTKSTTVPIKDACGMLENYATVDKALADLNGNTADFRLSEDFAFIEGMNQGFASTLFYGNTKTNPERFMGLSARYNDLTTAPSKANILSGGGSGSTNTSVWLIIWGEQTVHGIYPNGSTGGLSHRDLGEQTVYDAANQPYQAYRTHYKWDCGLTIKDWRYAVRIANVDVTTLTKNAASGSDLIDLMIQALEIPPSLQMGKATFLCNKTVRSYLRRQMVNKTNLHLLYEQIAGKHVLSFDEVPVLRCDSLLNTEATVS
jgi:hypothetical protein